MNQPLATTQAPQRAIDIISRSGRAEQYLSLRKESQRAAVLGKVQAMLEIEKHVSECGKIVSSVQRVAIKNKGKRGFSYQRLYDDFKLWRDGGQKQNAHGKREGIIYNARDWRLFLKNYTNGNRNAALRNEDFVHFICRLFADTSRQDATGNALYERLLDIWFAGDDVPGYGNIRQWCAALGRPVPSGPLARARKDNFPDGWSKSNLLKMLPSKSRQVYLQRGEHAAHSHWGDQLLRDRSKLMPLQLVTFDDVDFDIQVIQPIKGGVDQVVRPKAIFCMDVGTGMILDFFILGSIRRSFDGQEGGKKGTTRSFNHADMRWFLAKIIEERGMPVDWQMHILVERAAATFGETDVEIFENQLGLRIDKTGRSQQRLTSSGFVEHGGKPWQKGWIEAYFRALHTRINHLPMTIGRRYDLSDGRIGDEDKKGSMLHYTVRLLKKAHEENIPLEDLKLPPLTMQEFHQFIAYYVDVMNWRTNHSLQGFSEVSETRLDDGSWITFDQARQAGLVEYGMQFTRRMEAPAERYNRLMVGHREFRKPHPRELAYIRMDKKPITVAAEKVTVKRSGKDNLIFRDLESAEQLAKWNGRKKALLGFISADKSCIHLFTNDGELTYVCSPRRVGRVDLTDNDAILERAGEVHRGRQLDRTYAADLCADQEIQISEMREHNKTRLGMKPHIAEHIQKAEQQNAQHRQKIKHVFERAENTSKEQIKANRRDADLARAAMANKDEDDY